MDRTIVTVPEVFAGAVTGPVRAAARMMSGGGDAGGKNAIQEFKVLQNVTGTFRPGEITLVLAPPGHGKTALLKALAGVLPPNAIEGTVKYTGHTPEDLKSKGISVNRLATYVEQVGTRPSSAFFPRVTELYESYTRGWLYNAVVRQLVVRGFCS